MEEDEATTRNRLYTVARNPETPIDELVKLADSPSMFLRIMLLANPNLPAEVLHRWAVDGMLVGSPEDDEGLNSIAKHPNVTLETLEYLRTRHRLYPPKKGWKSNQSNVWRDVERVMEARFPEAFERLIERQRNENREHEEAAKARRQAIRDSAAASKK